ncbi:hypothetical protein [Kribbia dieselivorans]|uniref:hypothetical protein n=1 Tax=Kribbia dieselivorans TaxID=331526 RepID=UPI0012ED66AB|nr:hypothetical protein [Kribbia dieselivorans]
MLALPAFAGAAGVPTAADAAGDVRPPRVFVAGQSPPSAHLPSDIPREVLSATSAAESRTRLRDWLDATAHVDRNGVDVGPGIGRLTRAQVQDALTYAEGEDLAVDEALLRDERAAERQRISDSLERRDPGHFAGVTADSDGVPVVHVSSDSVPSAYRTVLGESRSGAWVQQSVLSLDDADALLVHLNERLGELARASAMSWDVAEQKVTVTLPTEDTASRALSLVRGQLPEGVTVEARADTGLVVAPDDSSMRGGGYLDARGCTAGFVMRKTTDGTKRNSTAGHCLSLDFDGDCSKYSSRYSNHVSDGGSTEAKRTWCRYHPMEGDIALLTTGTFTPLPTFYYDFNQKRYVTGAASSRPAIDHRIYHFGATTGMTYAFVESTNACHGGVCGMIGMRNADRARGDSGGPWYAGGYAWGIHHGVHTTADTATFTPIYRYSPFNYEVWQQ